MGKVKEEYDKTGTSVKVSYKGIEGNEDPFRENIKGGSKTDKEIVHGSTHTWEQNRTTGKIRTGKAPKKR